MDIHGLKNKKIAVLGFGQEGKAVANYLIKHGVKPVLFDHKPWDKWSKEDQNHIKSLNVNFIFGPDAFKELSGFNVAFRSPGIKFLNKDLQFHVTKGLYLTSQTQFFFENCPADIIGVTGTKGKGTTASLIFSILKGKYQTTNNKLQINSKSQNPNVYLTGNIGEKQPLEFLDNLKPNDWIVYELSSFQLQDLKHSPHVAVVLMVTSEHQNYHKGQAEYAKAKEAITKYQVEKDIAIVNSDYANSERIGGLGKSKKVYFSRKEKLESGCFLSENQIVIKNVSDLNFSIPGKKINLIGEHNLENVCAAIGASIFAGADKQTVIKALKNYKGLPHRLEFVAEKDGIKFYDDSISTIPETTIAAINSFSEPKILILGGSSKNSDFTGLGDAVTKSDSIKAVILIGQEASRIKPEVTAKTTVLEGSKTMSEVFEQIKPVAKKGDVVLLSPACASFGMFKNYQERGEKFRLEVEKW